MENINKLIIAPTLLSIITTYRCTSSCENCCFQCNPYRNETLSVSDIKRYIEAAVNAYTSIKSLVLTGGECFLYQNDLEQIISHALKFNLQTRVVTNGFWASNYQIAFEKLKRMMKVGLKEVNFSTGDEHLKFVPINKLKNGILASVANNLTTVVNVESGNNQIFVAKYLEEDKDLSELIKLNKILILNGIWIPFKKSETKVTDKSHIHDKEFPIIYNIRGRCENLFKSITIDPNHRLLACCGITVKCTKYLDLGNINKHSIKFLYERQFEDFLKIWLATDGPHKIFDFIAQYISIGDLNYYKMHPCQLCAILFNNSSYLKILQDNYKKVYTNIILKYNIYKKEICYGNQ